MEKYFKRTVYIRLLIVGIIDVAGRQNLYIMKTLENEYIGEAALIILNGICLRSYPIYIYILVYIVESIIVSGQSDVMLT